MRIKAAVCILLGLILTSGIGNAAMVSAVPAETNVFAGETFTIDLVGQDFDPTMGGDSLLQFDGSLFSTSSDDITYTWPGDFGGNTVSSDSVSITVGNFVSAAVEDDFGIAQIVFTVASDAAVGSYDILLSVSSWTDSGFAVIDPQPDANSAVVNINLVPLPSAVLLLGGGMIGLFAVRRWRQ